MIVSELSGAEKWLYSTLSGDATMQGLIGNPARVYSGLAPEGSAFPYIVLRFLAGPDTVAVGGVRIMTNPVYLVMGIDKSSSFATLASINAQIETLIGNQTGATSDTTILSCVREQPYERADSDSAGNVYRYLGGRYRLQVQPLN
ncbi:MAG: hypothetical protein KGL39_22735 [Patescibacteria group bacterium]|nr:hypothetical protein [Patescibacteria group bacterium]